MILYQTAKELVKWRNSLEGSLGFVPTMGNLHDGHLSLVKKSLKENSHTLVSIFVNPKQFGPKEDFKKYPRTLDNDISVLKDLDKNIKIFSPQDANEIFPQSFQTSVNLPTWSKKFCGAKRPGHFEGVSTVVCRLFGLTKANRSYFGLKDYQQFLIIRKMVQDLLLPIEVKGQEIIRDSRGLALSSRNQYLKESEIPSALKLSQELIKIRNALPGKNYQESLNIFTDIKSHIKEFNFEYLEIVDDSLSFPQRPGKYRLIAATTVGGTRLIDNVEIKL